MTAMPSEGEIEHLLAKVQHANSEQRHELAAQLSKVAAKAEDPVLIKLGAEAHYFVSWLDAAEPLVRAYTACILANIAFLEQGQQRVLDAHGVPRLVLLLKGKEDKKVTLHATAAIQNLTYKNTLCCQTVFEHGGEKALKKLLQHKSEDVQQFAAGALANLQLYRRAADEAQQQEKSSLAPPINNKKSVNRKVLNILRRREKGDAGSPSSQKQQQEDAAVMIQSAFRRRVAVKEVARKQRKAQKRHKFDTFNVSDVRKELAKNDLLPSLPSNMKKLPQMGGINAMKPLRLAPLEAQPGPSRLPPISKLPPLPMPAMPAMRG